jgi:puromycin-sensitive aminopeptidase
MPATKPSRLRLPEGVRPTRYDVHLIPDLTAGTFSGEVRIRMELRRARRDVVVHAAELTIEHSSILVGDQTLKTKVTLLRADEAVRFTCQQPIPAGEVELVVRYRGQLNRHLRGLYGATANGKSYAFTQCETADCRRIMPCFDEPSFKARFRVAVTARDGDVVLANNPVESEQALGNGRRVVHFTETPPLSTYLFALAIGPLESSPVRQLGTVPIRVWHVPGKAHLAAFGLEAAYESLARLQDYFGIPYPYAKLDLVAAPDFEAGAMENAGAVFFRETLLLLDPATVSLPERKRAAEVIAHELAHMWYGDLVTMAWWDDLWLNEAFATWMAYKIIDQWKPEWRMWQGFEHDRAAALGLDALANTHPIYAAVHSVAEATENFDLITYEKGAAVVRMIEHYLGADVFRAGVRIYMERHREGNTVAGDLWRALEEASGQKVARVAQAWITQAGFPLVSFETIKNGDLRVRQERFFADPRVNLERRQARWPVPLVIKWEGQPDPQRVLVEKVSQVVPAVAGASWSFGNAAAGGFYRVRHAAAHQAALVAELGRALTPVERLALVGDQWALVRGGQASVESLLDIADALGNEPDHDVLDGVASPLATIEDQVVADGSPAQRAFRAWIAARFGPAWARAGWDAARGESDDGRLRRAALLRLVGGIAEDATVTAAARERLDGYLADRASVEPNLADSVVNLAARVGDDALYDRFRRVIGDARTPQERRRFLLSLAAFRAPGLPQRTLDLALTDEIPTQDVAFIVSRMFGNPNGREAAWRFLTKKWSTLKKRIPPLMLSRLIEATPALRDPKFATAMRAFFGRHPVPEARRALKQASEVFRLNADLRRRTAPAVAAWLAAHGHADR